jgi:hypothetical protein
MQPMPRTSINATLLFLACFAVVATISRYRNLTPPTFDVVEQIRDYREWTMESWRFNGPTKAAKQLFLNTPTNQLYVMLISNDQTLYELSGTFFGVLCLHINDPRLNEQLKTLSGSTNLKQQEFARDALIAIADREKWQYLIDEMTGKVELPSSPYGTWAASELLQNQGAVSNSR